jgi:hypothetical protein
VQATAVVVEMHRRFGGTRRATLTRIRRVARACRFALHWWCLTSCLHVSAIDDHRTVPMTPGWTFGAHATPRVGGGKGEEAAKESQAKMFTTKVVDTVAAATPWPGSRHRPEIVRR